MNKKADTLPKLLRENQREFGNRKLAMAVKDYGIWQGYTWEEYYQKVKELCLGLMAFGLKKGDNIAVLGETKPEAYWAELAVQAARGAVIGIFADCLPQEVEYFVKHSDSTFIIAHDQEQIDKILDIRENLPLLKKVVYWDNKGLWNYQDKILVSMEELLAAGRDYEKIHLGEFEKMLDEGDEDDVAAICYTSGTTGEPKGVMITHRCLIENSRIWTEEIDQWSIDDNYVSFLPLAWITEQSMVVATLISGVVVNFTEKAETVQQDIRETGPQILFWGARNWESVNRLIQARIIDTTFFNRLMYNMLLPIGYKIARIDEKGETPGFFWKALSKVAYWLLFRDLLDRVGLSRVRHAYTGGAPTSPDVINYFQALGIRIRVCYGSSEFPLISLERNGDRNDGTSGAPLPGVEVKISPDGEILAKGECIFKGYYKDPDATHEKLKDGWYHTEDAGHITEDGKLVVMDRLKDLRRLKNDQLYSPQYIESRIRFSPYIKDLLVVGGSDHEYVSGIVNIDMDNVGRWAEKRKISYTNYADISQNLEVIELIKKEFVRVNFRIPEGARVKKFINIHKEFDADDAELTRTRKIKRDFMEDRYAQMISALYSDVSEFSVVAPVTYRDGRKSTMKTTVKINTVD